MRRGAMIDGDANWSAEDRRPLGPAPGGSRPRYWGTDSLLLETISEAQSIEFARPGARRIQNELRLH